MMKKAIFILVFVLLSISSSAGEARKPLAAYLSDSLWHFIDYNGELLFPPMELIEVASYSEGLFRVLKKTDDGNKWFFIDDKGNIAIEPDCDIVGSFHNGRALVITFVDKNKEELIYGYIDRNGNQVIPKIYDDAIEFSEGKAYVMNENRRGYIDTNGVFLFELPENIVGYKFQNGLARISNTDYMFGFIDRSGKKIIDLIFEETGNFMHNFAPANDKSKMGYIDKNGRFFFSAIWDECREFSEGLAFVGANDQMNRIIWSVIDTSGMKITEYEYTNVIDYSEGLASVEKNRKWAFIDRGGFPVIDFQFDFAGKFKDGLAIVGLREAKKFGFIDKEGKFVVVLPENTKSITDLRFNSKAF